MPSRSIWLRPSVSVPQQQIRHLIVEQINFVNIKYAPMRFGQQSGLKHRLAQLDRLRHIHRANQPIFGDAERNLHEWRGNHDGFGSAAQGS